MLQKLLNNLFLLSVLILIFGCNPKENKDKITNKILPLVEKVIGKKIEKAIVLIFSEYDCESCAKNTFSKVNSLIENREEYKIYGIYFTTRKKNNTQYKDFIKNTLKQVIWVNTTQMELFNKVSQNSDKQHSPFILKIENSKVVAIKSISKN